MKTFTSTKAAVIRGEFSCIMSTNSFRAQTILASTTPPPAFVCRKHAAYTKHALPPSVPALFPHLRAYWQSVPVTRVSLNPVSKHRCNVSQGSRRRSRAHKGMCELGIAPCVEQRPLAERVQRSTELLPGGELENSQTLYRGGGGMHTFTSGIHQTTRRRCDSVVMTEREWWKWFGMEDKRRKMAGALTTAPRISGIPLWWRPSPAGTHSLWGATGHCQSPRVWVWRLRGIGSNPAWPARP